jgi:hypothetical protein
MENRLKNILVVNFAYGEVWDNDDIAVSDLFDNNIIFIKKVI